MKTFAVAAGCLLSLACHAAPVYLECTMTTGQKDVLWEVSLDEAAGSASYSIAELGVVQKRPAAFTASKVTFNGMEIDRTSLVLTRTTNVLGDIKIDKGQCQLAKPKARAF